MSIYNEFLNIYQIVAVISLSISLVFTIILLSMCFFYSELQSFSYKLIFYFTISLITNSIENLINLVTINRPERNIYECKISGYIGNVFDLSTFAWSINITLSLYFLISKGNTYFLLFGYVFPFVWGLIPHFTNDYGRFFNSCWIEIEPFNNFKIVLYIIQYFAIHILNILIVFMIFALILIKIKKNYQQIFKYSDFSFESEEELSKNKTIAKTLIAFPLIQIFCNIFSVINTYLLIKFEDTYLLIFILHGLFRNLQGFFNFIAFALGDNVQLIFKYKIFKKKKIKNLLSDDVRNSYIPMSSYG